MKAKYIFTVSMLALMSVALFAQNAENKVNSQGKKEGFWKKYDDKGVLLYEGTFNNGVPVGTFKYYHANGKLKSTTNFIQGTHKVHTILFDQNEKLAAEGDFVDQLKDGEWIYYSEKGTTIKTENYKIGKKHGDFKTFSAETGLLLEVCHYDNDVLNGERITYFTDGKISTRANYINGEMNGAFETYFPNEVLYYKGVYHNGLQSGNWDYFDESGKPRKSVEYKNGEIVKTYLFLNISGGLQKVNQENIAYFHKEGSQTRIFTNNGKSFSSPQVFEDLLTYIDFVDFCLINPNYAVGYANIVKYRDLGNDRIEVVLNPATEEPVICEGDYAKSVKMLFNSEVPKED
ncbi:MAG: hypothetical protein MJZ70_05270 [Bacteroidales bacterium]|nr:hypothetical protein [Bacteroidales bacterium]